ncbi:MAG: hypothetical protein NZM37_02530 [Sandaracinaceae bacterium]|nr:hypothetical protein [Sandaracinaceae bacterium]MDW8245072.1 hypothetical protein [Sandaracinaceae bacterium]
MRFQTAMCFGCIVWISACGPSSENAPRGKAESPLSSPEGAGASVSEGKEVAVNLERFEWVEGEDGCEADSDCVPASCCHASRCVGRAKAPRCEQPVLCTMECRPGTIDCGGGCVCRNGRCTARIWRPDFQGQIDTSQAAH